MKKVKLNLDQLKVSSFVCNLPSEYRATIKGGQTVFTLVCCGNAAGGGGDSQNQSPDPVVTPDPPETL